MHTALPIGFSGKQLDQRYRLDRLLGEGASAWVFAAHDARLERDVAVKLLKLHRDARPTDLEGRFLKEGRTLAKLVHPNIVLVYDAGVTPEGFCYLVMELSEAGTLEAELFRCRVLSAEETVNLLLPLLGALACAHDRGIVHRDIKPANIVLASENGARCAKLLDFGIARRSDSASTDSASGTPSYMAPEQASGKRPNAAVDVWSMGVVFFRCLSGELPFAGESSLQALRKVVNERAPRFAAACPRLSPYLALALDRALERDPERRYPDMRSFAQALTKACVQDGIALAARREPLGLPGFHSWTQHADVEATRPLSEPERAAVVARASYGHSGLRRRSLLFAVSAAAVALVLSHADLPAKEQREDPSRSTVARAQIPIREGVPVHPAAAAPLKRLPELASGVELPTPDLRLSKSPAPTAEAPRKRSRVVRQPPKPSVESAVGNATSGNVSVTTKSGLVKNWDW